MHHVKQSSLRLYFNAFFFPNGALLWVVDRVDDGVEAACDLAHEAGDLGGQGPQQPGVELAKHSHPGIGGPADQPQDDVGDGHLGDAQLGALCVLVLYGL